MIGPAHAGAWPRTPLLAVDLLIRRTGGSDDAIVLIERRFPPLGWALPGGFVEIGESVATAALREAREETGLTVTLYGLVGCYSQPERDPRGHCVSIVFAAEAEGEPQAGDEAARAQIFPLTALPAPLVFDHAQIISDYLDGKRCIWR